MAFSTHSCHDFTNHESCYRLFLLPVCTNMSFSFSLPVIENASMISLSLSGCSRSGIFKKILSLAYIIACVYACSVLVTITYEFTGPASSVSFFRRQLRQKRRSVKWDSTKFWCTISLGTIRVFLGSIRPTTDSNYGDTGSK